VPAITSIVCSVVIGVIGQLILKTAMTQVGPLGLRDGQAVTTTIAIVTNPRVWAGFTLYGLSMLFWMAGLSRVELGYAFPFLSLSYVLILLGSWAMLGEKIGRSRLAGITAICVGVLIVAAG